MVENEIIGTEDLRFIYKSILDGQSDSEILNMYIAHKGEGGSAVPSQTDIDFIKNKRKELEIVSEVLKESIEKIIKMSIPKQREGHFAQIKEVSNILLENNLNTVVEYPSRITDGYGSKYAGTTVYTIKDRSDIPVKLNRMELIEIFTKNVDKANMGEEMVVEGGFWPEVEKKPYKVIKAIEDISGGKGIKGNCPMCNMETQLPPFLRTAFGDILQN